MLSNNSRIGPYEIISRIGSGGMGDVYRARDTRLGREVALKVIAASRADDASAEQRFLREARAVAALSHPNVLTLFDFGIDDGRSYAAMELIEGDTLRVRAASGRFAWEKAVEVVLAIADGLAAAHARGIVHRDLKPENVMITTDGRVKILDFGLARFVPVESNPSDATAARSDETMATQPGVVMGTCGYMAPEQARGGVAEAPADLFALGCILYELVTGRRAFAGSSSAEVVASVLRDDPPEVTGVPSDLARLIDHCLEKNPAQRFQSARDLTFQLRGILSAAAAGTSSSDSRRAAIPSIAICPFTNTSGDPEGDYLSEGIASSINASLSRLPNLRVMSRTTMSRYRGREIDPVEAGRELGVRALLTGRVLHRGETLAVRVELVNTEDGSVLWTENYHRQWKDVLVIEEEIAVEISERLRIRIKGDDAALLHKKPSENAEAYRLFLKGRFHCEKRTPDGVRKAIAHYQEAIDFDPTYALAYAGIAEAYNIHGFYMHMPPADAFPKARAAAMKALSIDPALAEAHCARAYTYFYYEWDWPNAEREYRRAIELDPTIGNVRQFYAVFLLAMGRQNEAFAQISSAEELDPLGLPIKTATGWLLSLARRYDEAIRALTSVLEMDPHFLTGRQVIGWSYLLSGRIEDALEHLEKAGGTPDSPAFYRSSYAQALAAAGRTEEAKAIVNELQSSSRYVSPFQLATVWTRLGDHERAFACLDDALRERAWQLVTLCMDARLDPLRNDPRFDRLVKAVGLSA